MFLFLLLVSIYKVTYQDTCFVFPLIFYVVIFLSHDLDNILLENLGDLRTLQAVFELEALILTGIANFY